MCERYAESLMQLRPWALWSKAPPPAHAAGPLASAAATAAAAAAAAAAGETEAGAGCASSADKVSAAAEEDFETGEACRVLEAALQASPRHPGLCHFYVHLMEMSPR